MITGEWAEHEVATAIKKENPDWDGKSFDYECSCYLLALNAYKSLLDDGHSGYTFNTSKNILKKLLDNIPLSPITDNDFFNYHARNLCTDNYLKRLGLKSQIQCARQSSLFRNEYSDGTIKYNDINRQICIDAECPSDILVSSASKFINDIYPITMPYIPFDTPFKVYIKRWTVRKVDEDCDIVKVIGYKDQQGLWHTYNKCTYCYKGHEYDASDNEIIDFINNRQEPVNVKIISSIIPMIEDIFLTTHLYETDIKQFYDIEDIIKNVINVHYDSIKNKCECLAQEDEYGICYLNTSSNQHIIINGDDESRNTLIEKCKDLSKLINEIDDIKKEIDTLIENLKIIK